jgi:hypothetical protein
MLQIFSLWRSFKVEPKISGDLKKWTILSVLKRGPKKDPKTPLEKSTANPNKLSFNALPKANHLAAWP